MTSLTGNGWVDVPIVAAALLAAWYTIWRRGLKPAAKAFGQIADTFPILVTLAVTLQRVEGKADTAALMAEQAAAVVREHIAADREAFEAVHATLKALQTPIANIEQIVTNGGDSHGER